MKEARWVAKGEGLADLSIVEAPYPVAGLPQEMIEQRANACIDDVVQGLTQTGKKSVPAAVTKVTTIPEPASLRIQGIS